MVLHELIASDQQERLVNEIMPELNQDGVWLGELKICTQSNNIVPVSVIANSFTDNGVVTGYAAIMRNIEQDLQERNNLRHIAEHDSLTDLANRYLFQELLVQALSRAKRAKKFVAVLYLDLDAFKPINDTLGHAYGDKVLIEISRRLKNNTRASDIVARIGGDEFVVLMEDMADETHSEILASLIVKAIAEPIILNGEPYCVTASVGISICPVNGASPEELITAADSAMYRAKKSGKNQIFRA